MFIPLPSGRLTSVVDGSVEFSIGALRSSSISGKLLALVNYLASNVVSVLDVAVPIYHHDSAEFSMKSGRFSVSLSQKSTMV